MAENSTERHEFIDCMYALYVATRIDYTLPGFPRQFVPKHKAGMEARFLEWGYNINGEQPSVMEHYCRGLASADLGNNLINRMHCLSIACGRTPFMEVKRPEGHWESKTTEAAECFTEAHTEYDLYTRFVSNIGDSRLEVLPPRFGMLDSTSNAERWISDLEEFKRDPFSAPGTVSYR